jgi:hypothetical protein
MTSPATFARAASGLTPAFVLVALVVVMAGCGSSGPDTPPVADNPPPVVPIEGIATPSSVAVVTATNAQ